MARILKADYVPFAPAEEGEVSIAHAHCEHGGPDHKKRLGIRRNPDGSIVAHCFNCGGSTVHRPKSAVKNMYDMLDRDKAIANSADKPMSLPPDCISKIEDWPDVARAWLYRYDITNKEIRALSIVYSPSYNRVILPIYYQGALAAWQGRSLDKSNPPKYIGAKRVKGVKNYLKSSPISSNYLILTEDLLSAIRVNRICDAMSLGGTSLQDETLGLYDFNEYRGIIIMLDDDNPTVKKQQEDLKNKLETMLTIPIYVHHTDGVDPKEMGRHELRLNIDVAVAGITSKEGIPF